MGVKNKYLFFWKCRYYDNFMIIYLLYSIFINKSIDKLLVLLGQIRNNDPDYVVSAMIQHKLLMHFYFYHENNARAVSRMNGRLPR